MFKNVIIWGYPYGTHTHSFVWYGFYRAFKSLGYPTYWANSRWSLENYSSISLSDSLIICEKNDLEGLPISKESTYLVHMMGNKPELCVENKFRGNVKRLIDWRQFCMNHWDDVHYDYSIKRPEVNEIDKGFLFEKSSDGIDKIYCAWATDLLPDEINLEDRFHPREKVSWYLGTVGGGRGGIDDCLPTVEKYDNRKTLREFREACNENGIEFIVNCPWINPLSQEESRKLVKSSFLAVDSRHPSMIDWGYIPCRTMKNMSYGHLGLTNSKAVHDFFEGEVIYSPNGKNLFYEGLKNQQNFDMIKSQMNLVKDYHTYINRAKSILKFLEM